MASYPLVMVLMAQPFYNLVIVLRQAYKLWLFERRLAKLRARLLARGDLPIAFADNRIWQVVRSEDDA